MAELPEQLSAILTDRYRVQRELGSGGMATVYLADDLKLDRQVALKVLRPELAAVLGNDRFLAEVKITARLDHPHILTLIDSGVAGGLLYYVLPFVRGESLRDLLNREQQLGIEQALAITKQIGSALDYAHRHGVIHRDIKPENILLQEGEAMLADFGIALAVQESGGNRLTETGLSLGTPQYMSPEQATGDRNLDARSDVYSLAAVLYEMLTGEPPVTGKTVQAVIAKLLTEQPTRVRTVRNTVAVGMDNAIAKALAKVPADRFGSAGDFVRALEISQSAEVAQNATGGIPSARPRSRKVAVMAVVIPVVILGAIAAFVARGRRLGFENSSAALRDRTQLTFSGKISVPALSQDGKQLAYFTKSCVGAVCKYALDEQDVGSTVTRHVVEGASAGDGVEWSPDRRNLIFSGAIGNRYGSYLISALGGPARYLTAGAATFYAGGDSLLLGSAGASTSTFTVRIAGLDGAVHDSIHVPGPGQVLATLINVPGTTRIIAMIIQSPHGLWQVLDRTGKVTDKLLNSCTCGGVASRDAVWMTRAGPTVAEAVVRLALDPATGKLATHQDTIYSGRFTNVSVTADGTQMAVDDGSVSYVGIAGNLPELLQGRLPAGAPLIQSSTSGTISVSPDGARIVLARSLPGADGRDEAHFSVAPFAGGSESPLTVPGRVLRGSYWADSVHVVLGALTQTGSRYTLVDVRTGAGGRTLDLPDSGAIRTTPLADGWAWIPKQRDRIIVEQNGVRHEISKPKWFDELDGIQVSVDGTRLLFIGYNAGTDDSLGVAVVPTAGGNAEQWFTSYAIFNSNAKWLSDGSIVARIWSGPESVSLFMVQGPGRATAMGMVPHVATYMTESSDLKRATLGWQDSRSDAWMYRVVKP